MRNSPPFKTLHLPTSLLVILLGLLVANGQAQTADQKDGPRRITSEEKTKKTATDPTEPPSAEELQAALKQLGGETWAEREAASGVVWRAGLDVLPRLETLIKEENDPEVRGRAREIQRHLRRGYIPGLPKETMKLVKSFHEGNRLQGLSELLMADGQGPVVANLLMEEAVTEKKEQHDALEYVGHRVREKAWALIKDDQEEEGLELFERSYEFTKERLKNHRAEANTWNGFAWDCALSRQHLDEGLKAIDHALRLDPTDYTFLDTKAELLFVSGDRAGAKKWIDRAIRLRPNRNPEYYVKQKRRFTFSGFDSRPDF